MARFNCPALPVFTPPRPSDPTAGRGLWALSRQPPTRERHDRPPYGGPERLGAISCPNLVISAEHNDTPVAVKEHYVTLISDARLVVIKDSRHATPLYQPASFNHTLPGFIASADTTLKDQ